MTVYAGTGHRPEKLRGYTPRARDWYKEFAIETLAGLSPAGVITGMALGWDTALAEAAIELDLPFVAAIPFEGQEYFWPEESQTHYHRLLVQAKKVVVVSHGALTSKMMKDRNVWMVNKCDHLLALWDGDNKTGTAHCVHYAQKARCPVTNVWSCWLRFLEEHDPSGRKKAGPSRGITRSWGRGHRGKKVSSL